LFAGLAAALESGNPQFAVLGAVLLVEIVAECIEERYMRSKLL
jgi:hypothetical protein